MKIEEVLARYDIQRLQDVLGDILVAVRQEADLSLETLQNELATLDTEIDKMHKRHAQRDGMAMNPAGDFGGIRSRSQKAKDRIFAAYSTDAAEGVKQYKKRTNLRLRIELLQQAPGRARYRWLSDLGTLFWWDSLEPGDTFTPGNDPLPIRKVNKVSLITGRGDEPGISWSITEVTGLRRQRVQELRDLLAKLEE